MLVNAYCTCRTIARPAFPHELRGQRDRSDPELVPHLEGFMGFVMAGGKRPMSQSRYHVIRHIERVRNHLSIELGEDQLDALAEWAVAANAILFLEDGTVRAPSGLVLVDPKTGDAAPGADVPYPPDAIARKARTAKELERLKLRVPASLPPVVGETEVELRSAADVARRGLGLFACALRAESLAAGEAIPSAQIRVRMPAAAEALTPRERAFFEDDTPDEQSIVNHVWRYESLAVLLWALGRVDHLGPPSGPCDVQRLARTLLDIDPEQLIASAALRPATEILDALDLHLRLHWVTTDARVGKRQPPEGLEPGVILERHHALNWLTRFEDAEWDDVTTPT